jgi:hypothetical protein
MAWRRPDFQPGRVAENQQGGRLHALLAAALRQCGADPAEAASHLAASGDNDEAALRYTTTASRRLDRIRDHESPGRNRAVS